MATKYRVIKPFQDHLGRSHFVGEVADVYESSSYGVLGKDEVPLVFFGDTFFVGVNIQNIELAEGEEYLV